MSTATPTKLTLTLAILVMAALAPGCAGAHRGDTVFRVEADSLSDEKTIRRNLWRVQRAVEDVRVRYALEDISIEVIVTDLDGLGQASPALSGLANVSGAKVFLSDKLFLDDAVMGSDDEMIDAAITGLIAHELMHALHYARMDKADLIELGIKYRNVVRNPDSPDRAFVRNYERLTDLMTIEMGYGEQLIQQKRASEANLAINDPPGVWDFYLTEPEIRALIDDDELLLAEINSTLDALGVPSASSARKPLPIDQDGDLIRER